MQRLLPRFLPLLLGARAAQLVLYNATIRTSTDHVTNVTSALCVDGDRIAAVGHDAVRSKCPDAQHVNLNGTTVVPGLVDSHAHVMMEAARRRRADLSTCGDADACAAVMAAWAANDTSPWALGFGFDQTTWPGGQWPTKEDLDAVLPSEPARADHVSGHACWVNSKALAAANITADTPDPAGGTIGRDGAGEPTGILTDNAMLLVDAVLPAPSAAALDASVDEVLRACAARGLTGVHDLAAQPGDLDYYAAKDAAGELTLRLHVYRDAAAHGDAPPALPWANESALVRCRGAKFFADGAMGSWTAAMLEPYSDKNTTGTLVYNDSALLAGVSKWRAAGYQVATHAIGDAANRQILDVYEAAGVRPAERFRVEHVQILNATDVGRFAKLGVIPAMQPSHVASDLGYADARLGPRANLSYAWRSLKNTSLHLGALPLGSDFPTAGSIPVLLGFHAAVTRETPANAPAGGWHPEQRLTPLEALRGYTRDAAVASFREGELGALLPGYLADLTVLAEDPVTVAPRAEAHA
eukprot:CAMPEP_0119271726 /NCGR_PEP_ID=MMETSP1329-20130426/8199_1 /TAXON_ID=114041 /ORGANISM="Genus nov. species nov., Strain RCC1024" /LENGTH=526 /DNA_ID=CAMNT_0007271777 /DNA_START=96 /DNA_END=1672 /DNA_ORIENTATION=-